MSRGDKTGPRGQGPMTRGGRGKFSPKDRASVPQNQGGMGSGRKTDQNRGQGSSRGAGRRQGIGRGRRS